MGDMIIYSLIGIVTLILVIIITLRGGSVKEVKTKNQKRAEILDAYKLELKKALGPLKDDKEAKVSKKSSMLKKFNDELSRNIFFDKNEIRDIMLELSKEG
ncbi:MAG: hypothetical protein KAR81_08100 [Sulfurimonas sp.]|nr:hypothetical protein [Sulfurimonas sp.]